MKSCNSLSCSTSGYQTLQYFFFHVLSFWWFIHKRRENCGSTNWIRSDVEVLDLKPFLRSMLWPFFEHTLLPLQCLIVAFQILLRKCGVLISKFDEILWRKNLIMNFSARSFQVVKLFAGIDPITPWQLPSKYTGTTSVWLHCWTCLGTQKIYTSKSIER